MKKFFLLPLISLLIVACGNDEESFDLPAPIVDAPHSLIGASASQYLVRKEVPKVKDQSMFIVHYTDFDGVTYTEEWDKAQKTQRWAAYSMTETNSKENWSRKNWESGARWKGTFYTKDPFQEDSIIPMPYRTTLSDYSNQRTNQTYFKQYYNRGHIVNSQDRLVSQHANGQTFYLSNMQPQIYGFNGGVWLNMENLLHNKWNRVPSLGNYSGRDILYVVKGGTTEATSKIPNPLIKDDGINIPVPRYFWMAILCYKSTYPNNGGYKAIALWAEHKPDNSNNLRNYAITIDELEARTGIDFFHNLEDEIEKAVEANITLNEWVW